MRVTEVIELDESTSVEVGLSPSEKVELLVLDCSTLVKYVAWVYETEAPRLLEDSVVVSVADEELR